MAESDIPQGPNTGGAPLLDLEKLGAKAKPDIDGNLFAGSHIDPDEAAAAVNAERTRGIPASVARGSVVPPEPRLLNVDAIKSSKALTAYANGPEKAAIAADDGDAWGALRAVFSSAAAQWRRDVVTPAADTLTAITSGLSRADASILGALAAPLGVAGQAAQPLVGTVLPENAFARGEAALLRRAGELNQFADAEIAPVLARQKGMARDVMEGWGSFIPSMTSMALTAVTRMPAAGLGFAGATSGGGAYVEGREGGLAPAEALMYGLGEGVVEAGTEMIPALKIVDDLVPGAPLHKMLLNQLAAEIPGEQIATILQDLNAWAYLNPEKTLAEFVAERPDAAVKTLISTIVTSTAQTSAIGLAASGQAEVAGMQKRKAQAERAAAAQEYLQNLSDSAKASKMLTRDPLGLAQIIDGMAEENGAPSKFYIDAADLTGVLLQEGKTISDLADLLPSTKGQIIDSFIAGGTIEIPAGEFAVNLNGSTLQQGMAAHIRLEEDGFSVEQAKAFEAEFNATKMATAEKILRGYTEGSEFRREAARVRKQVRDELVERGRMSPEAADTNAALVEAFYVTAAKDWGGDMTPGALFDRVMKGRRVVLPVDDMAQPEADVLTASSGVAFDGKDDSFPLEPLVDGLLSSQKGVGYTHEIQSLDQRLRDAYSSLGPDGRGGPGLVAPAWEEPSRYEGERGGEDGEGSEAAGRAEQQRLVDAAKENGFYIEAGGPLSKLISTADKASGMEHVVYFVGSGDKMVAIRSTSKGEFGNTSRNSPAEYLRRLKQYNATFPSIQVHVVGVHQFPNGDVTIFTAQPFVDGKEYETEGQLEKAMIENGWFPIAGEPAYKYQHMETGAIIKDVHKGNVLHIGDKLFPIDVIVEKMPSGAGVYRQGGEQGPRLTSLHNLSAENLAFADKMGGLAVPSIAVAPAGMVHSDFGDITLIGGSKLGSPDEVPVFDADAYSARFPRPVYRAAKSKDAQKLVDFIRPWAEKFNDRRAGYGPWEYTTQNPNPQRLIDEALRSHAWRAAFLDSKGVKVEPVMRAKSSGFTLEESQLEKLRPLVDAAAAASESLSSREGMETPEFKALEQAYAKEVETYFTSAGIPADDVVVTSNQELYFSRWDKLQRAVKEVGQQEVDRSATSEALAKEIDGKPELESELKAWIEGKVLPMMGDPMLEVGRKKVPYTLENIVEYMSSTKIKGEEKGMTFGPGATRAAASKQFQDLEVMRAAAAKNIVPEQQVAEAREKANSLLEEYRNKVVEHYTITDWRGKIDTWGGLDASMRAIAKVATGKKRDKASMRSALSRENFNGVPDEVIDLGLQAAEAMLHAPVPYFEAKPQRAVKLSEFSGAVVPEGTSKATTDILDKNGIKWTTYKKDAADADLTAKVEQLTADLAAEGKDVLFQDRTGIRGTFNPATLAITLTNTSNLSTFLHESGHAFLDITMILAQEPDAPDAVRKRATDVLSWLGITGTPEMSAIDEWLSMSLEEKRPHHEKWAETFEQYLMKGTAPSIELADAFDRFRDWMVSIYKTLKQMVMRKQLAALDPEVTAIMDRMLATDEQIAEAKASRAIVPMFTSKPGSMTPEKWRAYQEQIAAQDRHEHHVIDRAKLGDMQWIRTKGGKLLKEMQKDARDKRAAMKVKARRNILSQPAYIARQILTSKIQKEAKAPREKDSRYLAEIDPTRDSAIIAIAKMGGMNQAAFIAEYGIDPADFRVPEMSAGHKRPAIVKSGGLKPGDIGERLAELGYIPTDQNGKWDNQALEDLLDDEARGNSRYSLQADYEAITGKKEQFSRAQSVDEYGFGGARLSRADIDGRYGWIDGIDNLGDMVADVGQPAEYIAMVSGFDTGEQMLKALVQTKDINEAIEQETDRLMLEAYGDISSPEALQRKVDEAMAGHNRSRILATELNIVAGGQGSVKRTVAAAREAARNILSGVRLADLRPDKYQIAATRAARGAMAALGKGDSATVIKHKRTEVLNNELFRQASKARDEIDRKRTKFREMFRGKDEDIAKRRNMDIVNVVRAVLADYGMAPTRGGQRAQAYMDLLREYNPQAAADITSMLQMLPEKKDSRELTLSEFRALADTVEGMWAIARADKVVTINGQRIEIEAVAGELIGRIEQIKGGAIPENKLLKETATRFSKFVDGLRSMKAMLIRVEQWSDMVGPEFKKYIFQPVSDAVAAHRNWRVQYLRKYRDLLKTVENDLSTAPIVAPELGFTFNGGKVELLHAILHTGNNSNKRKLLLGRPGWSDVGADGEVSTAKWDAFIARMAREGVLKKADFDFAQSVWDLMDEMKPASQEAHHKMYGYYFDEITASPVVTPFGVYKGGYVPAVADRNNPDVAPKVEAEELLHAGNSFMFPTTGRGFTKGRVEYNKPLELDLRAIGMHIDKVSRFVNIEPVVRDVARVTMREDVRGAIEAVTPGGVNTMLTPWLQRAARQTVTRPGASRAVDSFWRYMREKSGLSIMAANIVNVLQQTTGFSVAAIKVPLPKLARALWDYKSGPRTMAADISKKSAWMKDRLSNQAMEMQAQIERIVIGNGPLAAIEKTDQFFRNHGYFMQTALQNQMDIVVWSGAFDHALAKGLGDAEAVAEADSAVRTTQGTFAPEDIAAFEAGTPFARIFFQFAGYFNMLANTMGGEVTKAVRDLGYGRRTGRLFYVYIMGMMLPAVAAQLIAQGAPDDDDDEDGDGLIDEWIGMFFMSQFSTAAAMLPGAGTVAVTVMNQFDEHVYNDRMNISPVLSFAARGIERAAPAAIGITDALTEDAAVVDSLKKKDLKDALSVVALATGIPTGQIGKTAGYVLDVEQGNVVPETTLDYISGLVRGR